jgi:hypothetical protein
VNLMYGILTTADTEGTEDAQRKLKLGYCPSSCEIDFFAHFG